ncbi:GNAT family N-acetyltransferase [Diaminobutyricibacter tongyongensis]|uniref:GNAT family N-acetyltransferase n=1 Tax=Leifsonia tongyongensis TaxID=1268043 RepID=A0A6L9Y358_9MICO|nr:GNAT family N-acetyltransferase [Diaminobutyricibacter tongyongensis]
MLSVPRHPDVTVWRAATESDIGAIWELRQAMGEADHPNYRTARESIEADFALPGFEPERDSMIGFDSTGRAVAAGMVIFPSRHQTLVRSLPIGGVHPDFRGRGIGRALFNWQVGRARQQLASSSRDLPGWILAFADERAPQDARLFERGGLRLARHFLSMERTLSDPIESPPAPRRVRIVPYVTSMSDAVHRARDEVFIDHWGSQPMTDQRWRALVGSRRFAGELSFVALAQGCGGGECVVGFVLSSTDPSIWPTQGFSSSRVDQIGVRAAWRGRGIAHSLLATQLRMSQARGFDRVTLTTDGGSEARPLTLHSSAGFRTTGSKKAFVLAL